MKTVTVDKEQLKDRLSKVSRFSDDKPMIPFYSTIRFRVKGEMLELTGANEAHSISMFCDCQSSEDFDFCLDAKIVTKLVSSYRFDKVMINVTKDGQRTKAEFRNGKSKSTISCDVDAKFFSTMSLTSSKYEMSVRGSTIRHALKVSKGFVQSEDVSEVLDNICLKEVNGKLLFLSGTRIIFCRMEAQPVSINDWKDISIPGKVAQEIYSVVEEKGIVTLVSDGERLKIFNDGDAVNRIELISRLAANPYPNVEIYYNKEDEGTSRYIINTSDLSDTVDRSKIFSGHQKFSVVTLRSSPLNNQEIIVVADDPDTGKSYEETLSITNVDAAVLEKSFNSEMLSKILKQCDSGEIMLKFNPTADFKKGGAMVFITPNVDGAEKGTLRFIIMTLK